jgi:hypothetical protein
MADELHLRAEDAEDIAVLSSCLQDALVPLADMRYEPAERRFLLAVNRFRWEAGSAEDSPRVFERIACGIAVEDVREVRFRGIDPNKRDRLLELLAILVRDEEGAMAIEFTFAGGGTIRVEADRIRIRLDDFGEPWPTRWLPRHREAGEP